MLHVAAQRIEMKRVHNGSKSETLCSYYNNEQEASKVFGVALLDSAMKAHKSGITEARFPPMRVNSTYPPLAATCSQS